jgi:hypothetical protein
MFLMLIINANFIKLFQFIYAKILIFSQISFVQTQNSLMVIQGGNRRVYLSIISYSEKLYLKYDKISLLSGRSHFLFWLFYQSFHHGFSCFSSIF